MSSHEVPFDGSSQREYEDRSKEELLNELSAMRRRIGELEGSETVYHEMKLALEESEKRYRDIFESLMEGYFEVDLEGKFAFLNDSFCKIMGRSRDELLGMDNRQFLTPESAEKLSKTFDEILRTGRQVKDVVYEGVISKGDHSFHELSASLMRDWTGKPTGFRAVVRDITGIEKTEETSDIIQLLQAEEEKRKLQAQLAYAQKMESVGTLAGGIAHNFNNLLMAVQGNVSLLLLEMDSSHPHHKYLKNIESQVQKGATLTGQLLSYAREGSHEIKPISLNQMVKETSYAFGETRKEIMIHLELSERLYGIMADKGQIQQVLMNLYLNAAEAMPAGGDLFLETRNVTHLEIGPKLYEPKPGKYVLLIVRDTGKGIDEETKDRIFEPFFSTKSLAAGAGLGLASTYGIIKAHGGYIHVDSERNKGTTFRIYLQAEEKEAMYQEQFFEELPEGKGTILLVDDEDMVIDIGEQMLNKLGYEVFTSRGGAEALALFKEHHHKIDMVLLDMVMPDMGGGECFDRMKRIDPEQKVLLSSGYSIDGQAGKIIERGCNAFIQKPFNMEQLSQTIQKVLEAP